MLNFKEHLRLEELKIKLDDDSISKQELKECYQLSEKLIASIVSPDNYNWQNQSNQ